VKELASNLSHCIPRDLLEPSGIQSLFQHQSDFTVFTGKVIPINFEDGVFKSNSVKIFNHRPHEDHLCQNP